MRKKIVVICILGCLLTTITASTTLGITTTESSVTKSELSSQENIENELIPLDRDIMDENGNFISIDYSKDIIDNPLLNSNNPSNHKITIEPPWSGHRAVESKEKIGVADCWAEGTDTTGEYGKTTLHTWSGPGVGLAKIAMSLRHYQGFRPPKDSDYSFKFKFRQEGAIFLNSMFDLLGSSAARGGSYCYFYLWDGETVSFEKSYTVKDIYSIGGVGNGEYPYTISKTHSGLANLKGGKTYTYGANGKPWINSDGFVIAFGSSDHIVDFAGLQELEVEWPNSAPSIPELTSPSNGATEVSTSTTLQWSCSDPDGDYETLKYDVYLGESGSPSKVSSDQKGTSYRPSSLSEGKTYYWKIVVKDSKGVTKTSSVFQFTTKKEGLNRDTSQKIQLPKGFLKSETNQMILIIQRLIQLISKEPTYQI